MLVHVSAEPVLVLESGARMVWPVMVWQQAHWLPLVLQKEHLLCWLLLVLVTVLQLEPCDVDRMIRMRVEHVLLSESSYV